VIADILPRLDKVRRTGQGNWIACCPAHEDRSPSLTLREEGDGRILVRCHAGCSFEELVNAVGLGYEPWFPPKQDTDFKPAVRRAYPAADVLEALQFETLLVATAACNIANGIVLTVEDKDRVMTAYHRITEARRLALG
jgi:hypothetical protein